MTGSHPTEAVPAIFALQHFCLHDGPGVRSVIFFKGCPLRCRWCQNPESWRARPELGFKPHLCIDCQSCVAACPSGARSAPGLPGPDCRRCFACADACPAAALVRFGEPGSIEALLAAIEPEAPLLRSSGGGVTLSGGEPTRCAGFAADLAGALRARGIPVAMETCGQFRLTDQVARLLDALELVLYDVKLIDDAAHAEYCGVGNRDILANLAALAERAGAGGPRLWPRLPLIPGVTATAANLTGWAERLRGLGFTALTLVPYHELGRAKREWLGAPPAPRFPPADAAAIESAVSLFGQLGIAAFLPGEEPWDAG